MFDFITSDTHFHHAKILSIGERPFTDADTMTETLIQNWNRVVPPHATVLHLGDFAHEDVRVEQLRALRARLNGTIHLTMGNHDDLAALTTAGVVRLEDVYFWQRTADKSVTFSHLPLEPALLYRGLVSVHGHTHGPASILDPDLYRGAISANCELHGYAPIAWEDLEVMIAEAKRRHPVSWETLHA